MPKLRFSTRAFLVSVLVYALIVNLTMIGHSSLKASEAGKNPIVEATAVIRHCFPGVESLLTCFIFGVLALGVGLVLPLAVLGTVQISAANCGRGPSYLRCAIVGALGAPVFGLFALAYVYYARTGAISFPTNISVWFLPMSFLLLGPAGILQALSYRALARVEVATTSNR